MIAIKEKNIQLKSSYPIYGWRTSAFGCAIFAWTYQKKLMAIFSMIITRNAAKGMEMPIRKKNRVLR